MHPVLFFFLSRLAFAASAPFSSFLHYSSCSLSLLPFPPLFFLVFLILFSSRSPFLSVQWLLVLAAVLRPPLGPSRHPLSPASAPGSKLLVPAHSGLMLMASHMSVPWLSWRLLAAPLLSCYHSLSWPPIFCPTAAELFSWRAVQTSLSVLMLPH